MEEKDRINWLKTVKVEDKVYNIDRRYGSLIGVKEYIVKKITPTGKIRLDNDVLLDKDGVSFGGNFGSNSIRIYPMCERVEKAIAEINMRNLWNSVKNKVEYLKYENLNFDTLSDIDKLLDTMSDKKTND